MEEKKPIILMAQMEEHVIANSKCNLCKDKVTPLIVSINGAIVSRFSPCSQLQRL